jgi:hypothetical protein
MAPVPHAAVDLRVSNTSVLDLQHLQSRVECRWPKPENKHLPEYYYNLERHDKAKASIKHKYTPATKDNLLGIKNKFVR